MFLPDSIDKAILWQYVNVKIKHIVRSYRVFNVMTILFAEMIKDLKEGKEIKIHNLGALSLQKTKPRHHCDISQGNKPVLSKGSKKLKFRLAQRIKKKLRCLLDIDKTYGKG